MISIKNTLLALIAVSFSCSQTWAMNSFLGKSDKYISKRKPAKRFQSLNPTKRKLPHKVKKYRSLDEILKTPIIATKPAPSHILPKDFFIEDREDVIVEPINERMLHVHQCTKMEKEKCDGNNIEQKNQRGDKQYILLSKGVENWVMDSPT